MPGGHSEPGAARGDGAGPGCPGCPGLGVPWGSPGETQAGRARGMKPPRSRGTAIHTPYPLPAPQLAPEGRGAPFRWQRPPQPRIAPQLAAAGAARCRVPRWGGKFLKQSRRANGPGRERRGRAHSTAPAQSQRDRGAAAASAALANEVLSKTITGPAGAGGRDEKAALCGRDGAAPRAPPALPAPPR